MAWVGPASGAPAADAVLDAAGRAAVPGFVDSHSHLVFAGDRSAEFEARMSWACLRCRRHPDDGRGHPGRRGRAARHGCRQARGRDAAAGDHDDRGQVRLRPDSRRRAPVAGGGAGPHAGDDVPRRARRPGRVRGRRGRVRGPRHRADDGRLRPPRALGRRLRRGRRVRRRRRPRRLAAGVAAGLGVRVHAAQLGPGPGPLLAAEFGAASADHCTHLTACGRRRSARRRRRRHPAACCRVLDPFALPRRSVPARRRRLGRSRHGLQPRVRRTPRRCPSWLRWPCGRCG